MVPTIRSALLVTAMLACLAVPVPASAETTTITIRGKTQVLRLYGARTGAPIVVASGDGGWLHLGPHVAEMLAAKGFFDWRRSLVSA